jgi:DNA-binding transcriptional LysR family regulator
MTISLNRIDLNLLRVFDAVMEDRSVLRASQRICLSQSAVSHALARLREMLGDELFIRTTTGMQPTARAVTMAPFIREAWKSLEAAIGTPKFEPGNSARRFTIAASDFVTTVMVPNLITLLKREAPLVDLVIRPDSPIDLTEQMDLGQIDAVVGTFSNLPTRFRSSPLFAYDDVLIANSSRKLGKLSTETLSGLSIAAVTLHGEEKGTVDGFVSRHGLSRRSEMYDRTALEQVLSQNQRVTVSLPHFLALPALLETTDLVAIVPRPLAKLLARTNPFSTHELPYQTTRVDVSVLWHERTAREAPQEWLRGILRRATEPLRGGLAELESPRRSESAASPCSRSAILSPRLISPLSSSVGKVARL